MQLLQHGRMRVARGFSRSIMKEPVSTSHKNMFAVWSDRSGVQGVTSAPPVWPGQLATLPDSPTSTNYVPCRQFESHRNLFPREQKLSTESVSLSLPYQTASNQPPSFLGDPFLRSSHARALLPPAGLRTTPPVPFRRFSADVNKRSSERRPQNQRPRAEYESLPTHASSGSALVSQGGSASQQARRILAAPGALVLFVARAILYIITLRGLLGVANGSGGGSGGGVGAGGSAAQCPDEDVVTEAPGGAPAEPGEWEGNPQAAGKRGGEASRKISPLADRGLLLLLVLLHNRVSMSREGGWGRGWGRGFATAVMCWRRNNGGLLVASMCVCSTLFMRGTECYRLGG